MKDHFRSALGFCLLAAVILSTGPSHAQALKKVRVSIIPIIDVAPLMVARKQGFFAREGIVVDTSPTAGGAVGIPALVGGAVDITFGNVVSTMLAASQGLDIRVVAPATQFKETSAIAVLIGRKGDTYRTAADFAGKSIGVNTRNGINWLYARAWVKARGGDPDSVTYKEVPFPQLADAIKRRQIDAGITGEPFKGVFLKDADLAIVGSPFMEVQPGLDVGQYITTTAYATQNPDTIAGFMRALRKGIAWYNEHLTSLELAEVLAEYTRLPLARVKELPLAPMPTTVSTAQIQRTVEIMQSNGMLSSSVDASKFILPIATAE